MKTSLKRIVLIVSVLLICTTAFSAAIGATVDRLSGTQNTLITTADRVGSSATSLWPRNFSITYLDGATIPIPNPGTGKIDVSIQWTGSPLAISTTSVDGRQVAAPVNQYGPSYQLSIDTAAYNQATCPAFILKLGLAGNVLPRTNATGQVSVVSSPVDMGSLNTLIAPFKTQVTMWEQQEPQRISAFATSVNTDLLAAKRLISDQYRTASRTLLTTANTEQQQFSSTLMMLSKPTTSSIGVRPISSVTSLFNLSSTSGLILKIDRLQNVISLAPAQLNSISATSCVTGDQVTLTGVGLTSGGTQVYFTAPGFAGQSANILSFTTGADGLSTISVQVPDMAGVTGLSNLQVCAKALDRQPAVTTNSLPIQYKPITAPTLIYIDQVEVNPQTTVNVDGNGIQNGDQIRFTLPGVFDTNAATTMVSATRLSAMVPPYAARQLISGSIRIQRTVNGITVYSQAEPMIYRPTVPVISDIPASGAADSPIMLRGMTFGQSGEVHAVDGVGVDTVLPVDSWSDTHIIAHAPSVYGFTGTKPFTVYVKNGAGKSDTKQFSLTPTTDVILMSLAELKDTHDYVLINKGSPYCSCMSSSPITTYMTGRHQADMFGGFKGEDEYFLNRKLQNGWVVDKVTCKPFNSTALGGADSYTVETRVGTNSPYVRVHWWCDAMWGETSYNFSIQIKGPKGTQY